MRDHWSGRTCLAGEARLTHISISHSFLNIPLISRYLSTYLYIHLLLSPSTYTHYKNTIIHYLSTYYVVSDYIIKNPFNVERVAKIFAIFEKFPFWKSQKFSELHKNVFFQMNHKRSLKNIHNTNIAKYFFVVNPPKNPPKSAIIPENINQNPTRSYFL